MKINRGLMLVALAAAVNFGINDLNAQDRRRGPSEEQIQEFRQRRMNDLKERLEVKDDAEWKAIEPLIQKVTDARMATMSGAGRSTFGRGGGRPDDNNNNTNGGDRGGRDRGRSSFFGEPSAEAQALEKAIDGKASNADLKAAIAKYQESRKAKQAELEKAQADLRKVLSVRQEAIATMAGLL
jgi:hypothetical protein